MTPGATRTHRATALECFHELEQLAGMRPQPKRGWRGLRRKASDVARRDTDGAKVLNAQGGWSDSRTRESICQEQESAEVRVETLRVRRSGRLELPAPAPTGPVRAR